MPAQRLRSCDGVFALRPRAHLERSQCLRSGFVAATQCGEWPTRPVAASQCLRSGFVAATVRRRARTMAAGTSQCLRSGFVAATPGRARGVCAAHVSQCLRSGFVAATAGTGCPQFSHIPRSQCLRSGFVAATVRICQDQTPQDGSQCLRSGFVAATAAAEPRRAGCRCPHSACAVPAQRLRCCDALELPKVADGANSQCLRSGFVAATAVPFVLPFSLACSQCLRSGFVAATSPRGMSGCTGRSLTVAATARRSNPATVEPSCAQANRGIGRESRHEQKAKARAS